MSATPKTLHVVFEVIELWCLLVKPGSYQLNESGSSPVIKCGGEVVAVLVAATTNAENSINRPG